MMAESRWWWQPGVQAVVFRDRKLYLSHSRAGNVRAMFECRADAETDDPYDQYGPEAWAVLYPGGRIARYKILIGLAGDMEAVDE